MSVYSTLKSLSNEHIFEMTYFSGHVHSNSIVSYMYNMLITQNHADPYIRNGRQESPLDLAAQYGRMETVSELSLVYY